jgi:plastocyanin
MVSSGSRRSGKVWRYLILAFCVLCAFAFAIALHALNATATPKAPGTADAVTNVSIIETSPFVFAFDPAVITVTTGSMVVWTNNTSHTHTATSDITDTVIWDSGAIVPGASFTQTFLISGTFTYFCAIHTYMHGTIVVEGLSITPKLYLPIVMHES